MKKLFVLLLSLALCLSVNGALAQEKLVLITAGGIEQPYPAVDALAAAPANVQFVIPGGSDDVSGAGADTEISRITDAAPSFQSARFDDGR